jgi:hypothetical protein
MANVVDLTDFAPVDDTTIEIKRGDRGTGWFVTIGDLSNPIVQERTHAAAKKALKAKKVADEDRDLEESRRENLGWVIARVLGWTPIKLAFISPDEIEYSQENAIKVLLHPKMAWALAQIINAVADEKSFMKASAES